MLAVWRMVVEMTVEGKFDHHNLDKTLREV